MTSEASRSGTRSFFIFGLFGHVPQVARPPRVMGRGRRGAEQTKESEKCIFHWLNPTNVLADRQLAPSTRARVRAGAREPADAQAPRADETVFWVVGQARESCDQWDGARGARQWRERASERANERTNERTCTEGCSGTSGRWSFKLKVERCRVRCHSVTGRCLPCRETAPRGEKSSKTSNADGMRSGRTDAWTRARGLFPRWGTSGATFQDVFDVQHGGRPPSADSDPLLQNVERTAAGAPVCAAPPRARSRQRWPSATWQCVSTGGDGHPQSLGNRRQTSTYLLYHRRLTSRIPAISMMGMVTASERPRPGGAAGGFFERHTR